MPVKGTIPTCPLILGSFGRGMLAREDLRQLAGPGIGKHCSCLHQMLQVMDLGLAISIEPNHLGLVWTN